MTPQQAEWLRKNKHYRAVPTVRGGNAKYVDRGLLQPDGTFAPIIAGRIPPAQIGSFEVGVIKMPEQR